MSSESERRMAEIKVERRNGDAVMQALNNFNQRQTDLERKLVDLANQMNAIAAEIREVREIKMQDLVAHFGAGPTA